MRRLAVFISILTLLLSVSLFLASELRADPNSQLKSEKAKLAAQRKRLDIINDRERDLSSQLNNTQYDLQESRQAYHEAVSNLHSAEIHLDNVKSRLEQATKEFKHSQRVLGKRLREIYMHGDIGYLTVLLGSQSFTDFIDQTHYLSLIISNDKELLDKVRSLKEELQAKKADAEATVKEIQSIKSAQEKRVLQLENLEAARARLLADVQSQRDSISAQVTELENSTVALENQIQREINSHRSYLRPSAPQATRRVWGTGRYLNPAEGPITSPFGYRVHPIFGTLRFHTGVDIGAYYGSAILAADSGTVIDSGWMGGYGNCLIIDHGGGYSTLYAHCSELYVSYGQGVTKGQQIAAVGSTGNSTGPHLHFEVRINGEPVDPLGFIR